MRTRPPRRPAQEHRPQRNKDATKPERRRGQRGVLRTQCGKEEQHDTVNEEQQRSQRAATLKTREGRNNDAAEEEPRHKCRAGYARNAASEG